MQDWVRLRLRQAGLPKATAIHLVSSSKGAGVKDLVRSLHKSVGLRYDVWVVSGPGSFAQLDAIGLQPHSAWLSGQCLLFFEAGMLVLFRLHISCQTAFTVHLVAQVPSIASAI